MNELIKINQSGLHGRDFQTVNARDLHSFLEIGKDFSTWIKDRIAQYDFVENQDYIVLPPAANDDDLRSPNSGSKGKGGQNKKDYFLSIDMAKELSMVERNEKGKQARQYFIECERRAKADPIQILNDPVALRGLLTTYSEKVLALENKIQEDAPKVQALERISIADGSMCITNAAKTLQTQPKAFFRWLNEHKWIYRRPGGSGWLAYQDRIQQGLLEHKVTTVERGDGSEKIVEQVLITPRGLARLSQILETQAAA